MKKITISIIILSLILIVGVQAVTYTSINGLANDSEFRRFTDNIVGTWNENDGITLINGLGEIKNITFTDSKKVIEECVQDFIDPTICYYVVNDNLLSNPILEIFDLEAGNFTYTYLNNELIEDGNRTSFKIISKTTNEYFFTYEKAGTEWLVTKTLDHDNTANYTLPSGVPEISTKDVTGYKVAPMFTTYDGTSGFVMWQVFYRQDSDSLNIGIFYNNDTGTESFGYNTVSSSTGLCYNEANNDTRFFEDADFPSNLFANYGTQSGILTIKPSCRYYDAYYIEDMDNITGLSFPTSYFRDSGFEAIGQPLMIYQSGVLTGTFGNTSAYSQNELFINNSDGNIQFFNGDQYLNSETPIYAYTLDNTDYYAGFSDNIFTTIPLQYSTLIYPTGLYDYTIATNLSTLGSTGETISIQDYIETTGTNIGLQYGTDYITYILSMNGLNSIISNINTTDNSVLSITNEQNWFTSGTPVSIDGKGVRSDFVSSNRWNNLVLSTITKISQLVDYDLYPSYTQKNYTSTDTIKVIMPPASEGLADILTLRDTGLVVNIDYGKGNEVYPNATYQATKSTKFAPLDLDYSCTSGSGDIIYFASAISPSGSGLGICWYDSSDINPIILCSGSPLQTVDNSYPYSTSVNGVSASGQYVTYYYNSSAVGNSVLTTCTIGSGTTLQSICNIPVDSGTVRSMLRVNSTHSLIGTTLGEIGICHAQTGNVNMVDLGTISSENETILDFENRNGECSSSGCDETLDNFHFITPKYYSTAKIGTGALSVPNFCGDLSCNGGESAFSCPTDCSATCGDGFCTHDENSLSCPSDCGGAVCGNNICEGGENITSCYSDCAPIYISLPAPISPPIVINSSDLRALSIPSVNGVLLAGIFSLAEKVRKVDLSDYATIVSLTNEGLLDFPYAVDYYDGTVFVATDDEIHSFSGYSTDSFSLIERRGWGGFHSDIANDFVAINSTSGFVCDNFDEPDFYTIGSEPTGNYGGGCYAMEYDPSTQYLFVDSNDAGIRFWDVSNLASFELNNTQNYRSYAHDLTGDILDFKEGILATKRNEQSMTIFNVTTPSSPTLITHCNNGGYGTVTSIEIYNSSLVVAGLDNGKISLCNLNDNNETNNTNSFSLTDLGGAKIRAVEMDENNTIWLMTSDSIQPYYLNLTSVLNNTAPNITSVTVSANSVYLGEPVDIQVIAGNVETEDVIKYGIKCEGTETSFTQNSNGEFTCTYNTTGVYNLRVAVSDNYHVGTWFDERVEEIIVGEEVFSGGILRIEVLDENQNAIEGANVTVDGESKLTTVYGDVTFTTADTSLYESTTSFTGYYPSVDNFYADSSIHIVTLVAEPTGNETVLQVTVVDKNGAKVENALVSYTNTITYNYNYKFTNGLGLAIFRDIDAGTYVVIASKGDNRNSVNTNILDGNINEVEIQVDFASLPNLHIDRDCIDDGIWLCGDVETSCTQDSDCLSDQCTVGTNKCSRFNYSVCDVNGYPRSQSCVIKFTAENTLGNVTDWILSNLLWVIMLLVVVIGVGFIFVSWSPRR